MPVLRATQEHKTTAESAKLALTKHIADEAIVFRVCRLFALYTSICQIEHDSLKHLPVVRYFQLYNFTVIV